MCGILGCITDRDIPTAAFEGARDRMRHRGPDDGGYHRQPPVHLGARRLAILDLSAAGHQPMSTEDCRLTVAYNGEIYNFPELRRELEECCRFRSRSDTEVLLHGYRVWGWGGLLRRIDGMFAFALWDEETRALHLARDRVGKKPLYYCQQGGDLYFASTLDSLLAMLPNRPALDPRGLDAYLVYQAIPAPLTVFDGVCHLPPGHAARYVRDGRHLEVSRYWDVSYADKLRIGREEALDELERLLSRAVRRRLLSDVPVGAFLSGGVDSGLVTALMARESSAPVEAVTLGFKEAAVDERAYARTVASSMGVRLHEHVLEPDALQSLPAILAHYGQPLADVSVVPTWFVARAARRHVTVVLNGDGGDELFGGYARPVVARAAQVYRRAMPRWMRSSLAALAPRMPRRLGMLVRTGAVEAAAAFTYDRALRADRQRAYTPAFGALVGNWDPDELYRTAWFAADGVDDVDRALYGDFRTYLPDQLLVKMDVATMAHSLEARSPLLDTAVVEFAARLPTSMRLAGYHTKDLLKRLARRHLPHAVIHRRKQGFVMPAAAWLAGELAGHVRVGLGPGARVREYLDGAWINHLVAEGLGPERSRGDALWTVWVLELWLRLHEGSLQPSDRLDVLLGAPGTSRRGTAPQPAARAGPAGAAGSRNRLGAATRVLQVGMGWFPQEPGGLNRVLYQLCRHLPEQGVEVEALIEHMRGRAEEPGWSARGMARPDAPLPLRLAAVRRELASALRRGGQDLVAAHFAPAVWPALGSLDGVPLVVHFHGPWGREVRAEGGGALKAWIAKVMERSVYAKGRRFVVLSKAFGDVLCREYGVSENLVRVVPGGVEAARFAPVTSRREARRLLGWPGDRPVVLSVRRLVRRVGLDHLLTAVALTRNSIPDLWLVVVGEGPLRPELQRRAADLGLQTAVAFGGALPDEILPLAYRAADLSVLPSVALEGFGLPVVESLAAGTPVVGTPVGGIPEILTPIAPELVCEGTSPEHLAERLIAALSGQLRLPGEDACRTYAREEFDWPVVVRRVRAVYDEAVGSGR